MECYMRYVWKKQFIYATHSEENVVTDGQFESAHFIYIYEGVTEIKL